MGMTEEFHEYIRLVNQGWSEWWPLDASVVGKIPEFPGVYEIAVTEDFARLKGATKTLYIGSSDKRGLRALITARGRHIAKERLDRVRDELAETLWIRTLVTGIDDAQGEEKALLRQFEQEHLELPPCNHRL